MARCRLTAPRPSPRHHWHLLGDRPRNTSITFPPVASSPTPSDAADRRIPNAMARMDACSHTHARARPRQHANSSDRQPSRDHAALLFRPNSSRTLCKPHATAYGSHSAPVPSHVLRPLRRCSKAAVSARPVAGASRAPSGRHRAKPPRRRVHRPPRPPNPRHQALELLSRAGMRRGGESSVAARCRLHVEVDMRYMRRDLHEVFGGWLCDSESGVAWLTFGRVQIA
jgi:hypothetical protein